MKKTKKKSPHSGFSLEHIAVTSLLVAAALQVGSTAATGSHMSASFWEWFGINFADEEFPMDIPTEDAAVCGDGVREDMEECDDGNTENGDGCSATCQVETIAESLPPPALCPQGYLCTIGLDCSPGHTSVSFNGQMEGYSCQRPGEPYGCFACQGPDIFCLNNGICTQMSYMDCLINGSGLTFTDTQSCEIAANLAQTESGTEGEGGSRPETPPLTPMEICMNFFGVANERAGCAEIIDAIEANVLATANPTDCAQRDVTQCLDNSVFQGCTGDASCHQGRTECYCE